METNLTTAFESLPPSAKVAHNGAATGVSSITHTFAAQSGDFVAEATVWAQETNKFHFVLLKSSTSYRVYAFLRDNGQISWYDGSAYHDVMPYVAGQWYHIGFVVHTGSNKYDIWVNGQPRAYNATMPTGSSGNIDRIVIQASCSGCGAGTMYVDTVKVYASLSLTITGLQAGQIARFENLQGQSLKAGQVASGSTSLSLALSPGMLPFGTVRIFDRSWATEFTSPAHEFWGGDAWAYTKPWWNASLLRTRSGFLRTQNVYVNGSLPTGAVAVGAEDGWSWGAYDYPVAGATNHKSLYRTQKHEHYFRDATQTLSISGSQYLIQYVFIPENQYPSEIMLQFRDTINSWEHRAYWGANAITGGGWGTDGTVSRRPMGSLPGPPGRWLMLAVNATDVGMNGKALEGVNYTLYGGLADWDLTALGDTQTGQIRVEGLQAGWTVDLYDPKGVRKACKTVPTGQTAAVLEVYSDSPTDPCDAGIRAFPFEGYMIIRDQYTYPLYRSPVVSFWGGDAYTYGGARFFSTGDNVDVDSTIHDHVAGLLEYQTGRGAAAPVPQETRVRYTPQGLPDEVKVREQIAGNPPSTIWRTTGYGHDGTYGLLTSTTDPLANVLSYAYSPVYGPAYVTKVSDGVGTIGRFAYDPTTGWPLAEKDGRGYVSRYGYDALGRRTAESRYGLPSASEVLYFDMDWTTEEATPRMEDLSGQTLVSWETSAYNFQDQIATRTVARNSSASFTTTYGYDFLGRPTSVAYPGTAPPVSISYDDVNRIRTIVTENGRKVQYLYDLGGRTTAVREYSDATNYYTTSYIYDEVGNLLSVTNALNQVTQHAYDSRNRLTKTTYPDPTKYETYTYDEVGNLKTKRDRAGQTTTYGYDARYRLTSIDYGSTTPNPDVGYGYDPNDNPTTVTNYATNPATTVAYVYDGFDRATSETDTISGRSYAVGYAYDPAGRLTRLTYPDNTGISYVYDGVGRTSQVKDASTYGSFAYTADDLTNTVSFGNGINQSYSYNGRGWPTSIKATYGGSTYLDLAYNSYDPSGNILSIGGTTQSAQSFTYDKLDRLITASGGFGSQAFAYDAQGNRVRLDQNTTTAVLRPNGAGSSAQWTPVGCSSNWQCVSEATSDGDTTHVESATIGNVDGYAFQDLTPTSRTIVSVSVNAVARWTGGGCRIDPGACGGSIKLNVNGFSGSTKNLAGAYGTVSDVWTTNPATGQSWTVAQVNALQAGIELVDVGTAVLVTQVSVSVVLADRTTYAYANGATGMSQLTSLSTNGGAATTFGYDANGNTLSRFGGSKTCYAWNPENLLTQVKTVSAACTETGTPVQAYTYDGLDRRLNVTGATSSTWTVSIFAGSDVIFEKDNAGAVTKYVYANGVRIAKITSNGAVQYFLADHLGSTRKIISGDASRTELYSVDYEPFGKPFATTGTQPDPHKYTGEKRDDPTGLEYLRARQYDPELGRFLSADPELGSLARPQTLNGYAYVSNNPLTREDPSGMSECNAAAGDQLYAACQRWSNWEAFTAAVTEWQIANPNPWDLDRVMMLASFIPVIGIIGDAYFLGKALHTGLTTGEWDWLSIGLSAVGVAGFAVGMVRVARMIGHADDIAKIANRIGEFGDIGRTDNHLRHVAELGLRSLSELCDEARAFGRSLGRGGRTVLQEGSDLVVYGRWTLRDREYIVKGAYSFSRNQVKTFYRLSSDEMMYEIAKKIGRGAIPWIV